jgi:hypothetical protein
MTGRVIAYGEETDLQRRILALDETWKPYYDPRLAILHLVRAERTRVGWLIREFCAKGKYVYLSGPSDRPRVGRVSLLGTTVKLLALLARDISYGTLRRDRQRFPYAGNYFYEHTSGLLRSLGRAWAQLRAPSRAWRKTPPTGSRDDDPRPRASAHPVRR